MHKGHHQENMCGQYIDTQEEVLPIPRNPKTELRPQNNIENNVKKIRKDLRIKFETTHCVSPSVLFVTHMITVLTWKFTVCVLNVLQK